MQYLIIKIKNVKNMDLNAKKKLIKNFFKI